MPTFSGLGGNTRPPGGAAFSRTSNRSRRGFHGRPRGHRWVWRLGKSLAMLRNLSRLDAKVQEMRPGRVPPRRVVLVKVGLKLAGLVGEEATKDRFLPTGSSRSPHRHLIHLVRCRIRYVPGTPRTRQRQSDVKTSVKTFSATPVRSSTCQPGSE